MVKITWTTFGRVIGLESLTSPSLSLYHIHKVWCRGTDKEWIECGKAQEWFTNYIY